MAIKHVVRCDGAKCGQEGGMMRDEHRAFDADEYARLCRIEAEALRFIKSTRRGSFLGFDGKPTMLSCTFCGHSWPAQAVPEHGQRCRVGRLERAVRGEPPA